jgi:G3E family GTPase
MKMKKIDLVILTGFLGSGKSTLLKEIIQVEKKNNRKIGVIMNELGNVSIDSSMIPTDTPLKEMLNGCICCTIQGQLSLQLKLLSEEYDLDVIYIEATGAAHPLEIIDACTHPMIGSKVRIKHVITVVNAKQWHENKLNLKLQKLLVEQIKYANVVLLNKMDQVTPDVIKPMKKRVVEINKYAIISTVTFAKVDFQQYFLKEQPLHINHSVIQGMHGHESHVHNHLHLSVCTFKIQKPIERIQFLQWLESIQENLYRVKGFIQLKEAPGLYLFNYAYGVPLFEHYTSDKQYSPVLVFIGEGLNRSNLLKEIAILQS